ncbi:MAG: ATP-dependent helicase HrpB, partial [Aureliella sp.]
MAHTDLVPLPIDEALGEIIAAVAAHAAVIVEAPPGAGKTTRVAPAWMRHPQAGPGRVVLVEPRRIAARAAAARIAYECGVRLGEVVGYQVRFDRQLTRETRLAVVSPGMLLRGVRCDGVLGG